MTFIRKDSRSTRQHREILLMLTDLGVWMVTEPLQASVHFLKTERLGEEM